MRKFIFNCDPDDLFLAAKVANWLEANLEKQDAIFEYENGKKFFVRRNKTSISVFASDHWQKIEE